MVEIIIAEELASAVIGYLSGIIFESGRSKLVDTIKEKLFIIKINKKAKYLQEKKYKTFGSTPKSALEN